MNLQGNDVNKKNIQVFKVLLTLGLIISGIFSLKKNVDAQSPTPDQSNDYLQMQVEPAFDGNFKYGEWLPVWVELENDGPDLSGEVRVQVTGGGGTMTFRVPVDLPRTSRKRLPIYILPNNFTRQLNVQWIVNKQLLATQAISVKPSPPVNFLVGVISPERGALSLINGIKLPGQDRPIVLVDLKLSELPERFEGLRSFDVLILNDVDLSKMTPEQAIALEAWVNQGGRLVVGWGSGTQQIMAGLPKSLIAVKVEGMQELSTIQSLADFVDVPIRVPGPFLIATGKAEGKVLVSENEFPLVVENQVGSGIVDFVMLNLNASPFDGWSGTTAFWEKLLSPGAIYPTWLAVDVSARQQLASQMPYTLSYLPMLDLPSTFGLALLLFVYIILVGPINYLILRWQKKLHWAWVTIPVVTLIFSIAAFGLGYALHGTNIFLNKIAIIQVMPNGKAQVNSFIGLFSPERSAYELEVSAGELLSPLSPYYDPWSSMGSPTGLSNRQEMIFTQSEPGYVSGLNVDQWSMQSFMVEGLEQDFGRIESDLHLEDDALVGTIRNESQVLLSDAVVLLGKKFTRLGDILPGEEVNVNLDLSGISQPNFGSPLSYMLFENVFNNPEANQPSRDIEVKRMIVEGVFERIPAPIKSAVSSSSNAISNSLSQNPTFFAWIDEAPPEVRIQGSQPAQQTTALVILPISYRLPEKGNVTIPTGLVPGYLEQIPLDSSTCGEVGATAVYLVRGEAVFTFTLPMEARNVHVDKLKLAAWTDSGAFVPPGAAIYNWQTEQWENLKGLDQGLNVIPEADSLVNPDGEVQIRLTSPENAQMCYYLALGLEGEK